MKIIEIDALWKANFDQYQNDMLKSDQEAIAWAASLGADKVYKFDNGRWCRYIVQVEEEK